MRKSNPIPGQLERFVAVVQVPGVETGNIEFGREERTQGVVKRALTRMLLESTRSGGGYNTVNICLIAKFHIHI